MAKYHVELRDRTGVRRDVGMHLEAASPAEAVMLARGVLPPIPGLELYAVYRQRRLGRRRLVGTFPVTGGGDDGLAGVREPRRPLPTPPSLRAEADPPAYPDN